MVKSNFPKAPLDIKCILRICGQSVNYFTILIYFLCEQKFKEFSVFWSTFSNSLFFFQAPLKCKIEFQGFQGLWVVENLKSVVSQPGSHLWHNSIVIMLLLCCVFILVALTLKQDYFCALPSVCDKCKPCLKLEGLKANNWDIKYNL